MKIVHSLLKEYLGDATPTAAAVEELLTFHAFEIEGVEKVGAEEVIEVDVLPNRASDSLSHRGIARELATILDTDLKHDPLKTIPEFVTTDLIKLKISAPTSCPRFTASLIKDITVGESPAWLKEKLTALGQRSINNIVDATNYVMFTIGQPLHAYDADLFPKNPDGKWSFDIRLAAPNEIISLLAEGDKTESREVTLKGTELLVAAENGEALGLAGIKGGLSTAVSASTKNIIIEAAHFNPVSIRKTARGLGIITEATKRFENEPARELPIFAQQEIINLITSIAGGTLVGVADEYLEKSDSPVVTVTAAKVNSLLGLNLEIKTIANILKRLGAIIIELDETNKSLKVQSPFERKDLKTEVDYIEEIARINGLNNINSVLPVKVEMVAVNKNHYYGDKIRKVLIKLGFSEVITSSFQNKGNLQLQNALASDKSCMREDLTSKVSAVLAANYSYSDLLGTSGVKVFELGTIFKKVETGIRESVALAIGVRTKGDGYNPKDDVLLKSVCNELESALAIKFNWQFNQGVAEVNLTEVINTLPTPNTYDVFVAEPVITFKTVSPYPAITRDIALWVNKAETADLVLAALLEAAGGLCVRQNLFDTFTKDDRTSFAFRLVFQAKDRTLTDVEINAVMDGLYKLAQEKGWEVR